MKKIIGIFLFLYSAFCFAGLNVPATFGLPYLYVYLQNNQSVTANSYTKLQLNDVSFDSCNCMDHTTNYRWTPNVAGKYLVTFNALASGTLPTVTGSQSYIALYKNGASIANGGQSYYNGTGAGITWSPAINGTAVVSMNGTTDYLEVWLFLNALTSPIASGSVSTYLQAVYIGP